MTVIKPIQEFNLITSEPIKSITETKLCMIKPQVRSKMTASI